MVEKEEHFISINKKTGKFQSMIVSIYGGDRGANRIRSWNIHLEEVAM